MDPVPSIPAPAHVLVEPVVGLEPGTLLHRSRHADTINASWHGLDVVAKCVRGDLATEDECTNAANAIMREGLLLRRLEHPSIVRVVELVRRPATLVLELVPGRSMRDELRLRRRMPAAEAAKVGAQLADALDFLHRRWLMHRDVKPANVIYDGVRAVLIDFHLSKEPGPMRGGAGTRLFTAPEQVRGGHVTPAADVWGLGTVLYRAVTGRLPFHAESGHPQLTTRPVPALERLATSRFKGDLQRAEQDLPLELARMVDRMLAADPEARPSADEVAFVLGGMVDDDVLAP
jgi:serine/threonine protein kinase